MSSSGALGALKSIAGALRAEARQFALVGGLGVSVRAVPRFTRDVDVAVAVDDDTDAEHLIFRLGQRGFTMIATVEHQTQNRLATARLQDPSGIIVDLLFASSGIESEIVSRSEEIGVADLGSIPVARAEELLAMKTLSESESRLQDRLDARNIVESNPALDLDAVRVNLRLITERGFNREQDLRAKLAHLLEH